jgi:hypothetical protein
MISGVQTITVNTGCGAVLLELCGEQRNSFPAQLKLPATPIYPI